MMTLAYVLHMLLLVQALLAVHWLLDYPLQGDFLSNAKRTGVPPDGGMRVYHLIAHAGIQGAGVTAVLFFFIGPLAVVFGIAEWIAHAIIDEAKVREKTSFADDQALHITCKLTWAGMIIAWGWLT